ncbi:hypothetical protein ACH4SP_03585 [Streptomyces sp. NPDC021093]|uniref:hypothetical protein n=1 Tax=Streptomyces sp. NPDC021093 TaxID=3365112 RepID=UPI0037B7B25D
MIGKFWETFAGKATEQWMARLLTPALLFWLGGLAAWTWSSPRGVTARLDEIGRQATRLPVTQQLALLLGALLAVALSAVFAERITPSILRTLEGYWPRPFHRLFVPWHFYRRLRAQRAAQAAAAAAASALEAVPRPAVPSPAPVGMRALAADARAARRACRAREGTARVQRRLIRAQLTLRTIPADFDLLMPTRLGNLLRAVESRPRDRFGLDVAVCWPYLWLLLDEATKAEVVTARSRLDTAARAWLWSAVFVLWTFWAWWALPVAITAGVLVYRVSLLPSAGVYGTLVEAAFTLNRHRLYEAVHLPPPADPAEERARGKDLTAYLWRGVPPQGAAFHYVSPEGPSGERRLT